MTTQGENGQNDPELTSSATSERSAKTTARGVFMFFIGLGTGLIIGAGLFLVELHRVQVSSDLALSANLTTSIAVDIVAISRIQAEHDVLQRLVSDESTLHSETIANSQKLVEDFDQLRKRNTKLEQNLDRANSLVTTKLKLLDEGTDKERIANVLEVRTYLRSVSELLTEYAYEVDVFISSVSKVEKLKSH